MKRRIFSVFFALVLVLSLSLVTAVPAAAATPIYVNAETGNDEWDGQSKNPMAVMLPPPPHVEHGPKATITAGIAAVDPGGTVIVADGIYTESLLIDKANLTLKSENGKESTTIQNVGNAPSGQQTGIDIAFGATNFTLGGEDGHGFTIVGGTAGRLVQLTNGPSGVEISYNTINSTGDATHGISVGAAGATNLTVSYNNFISDANSPGGEICFWGVALVDVTVTHNDFSGVWNPEAATNWFNAVEFQGTTGNSVISFNTVTELGKGIVIENGGGTSGLTISNNDVSSCDIGIKLGEAYPPGTTPEAMTTVTVTGNTLSNNTIQVLDEDFKVLVMEAVLADNTFDRAVTVEHPPDSLLHTIWSKIEDAVDAAVAGDTINVAAGEYDGFEVIERNDISIIGVEGTVVTGAVSTGGDDWSMALVMNSANITIDGINFDGVAVSGEMVGGISYVDSTGSIVDLTVSNIAGAEVGMGIMLYGSGSPTTAVDISAVNTENSTFGIAIVNAEVSLDGCIITGMSPYGGLGVMVADNATVAMEGCEISDWWVPEPEPFTAGIAMMVGMPEEMEEHFVIGEEERACSVNMTGSTISNNNLGIYVDDDGDLVANFNNIAGNDIFGVFTENPSSANATNNWWGAKTGPKQLTTNVCGNGDEVSDLVDYSPWRDAAYPDGGSPRTYNVQNTTTSDTYNCIQYAINDASPGDNIIAATGIYNERINIPEEKHHLTLEGADKGTTTIDGTGLEGVEPMVTIFANKTAFSGFTVQHAGVQTGDGPPGAGIAILASECTIEYNIITANEAGIMIHGGTFPTGEGLQTFVSDGNVILGNEIYANTGSENSYGIMLLNCSGTIIDNNLVAGNEEGGVAIFGGKADYDADGTWDMEGTSQGNQIVNNGIFGHTEGEIATGVFIFNSSNNIIENNYGEGLGISGNGAGIGILGHTGTFHGADYEGEADSNCIRYNGIYSNTEGIWLAGATDTEIKWNYIYDNPGAGSGIHIGQIPDGQLPTGTVINYNNIYANSPFGVYNETDTMINAENNYWGDNSGPEHLDHPDGTGDPVMGNVDYCPWLVDYFDTALGDLLVVEIPLLKTASLVGGEWVGGWNTFSTPIKLLSSVEKWGDLASYSGLDYLVAYRFDADNQQWTSLSDDYPIRPLEGFFIKMKPTDGEWSIPILMCPELTNPPSRDLPAGWSLIGLNPGKIPPETPVEVALSSIATAGNLPGWSQVVNPLFNLAVYDDWQPEQFWPYCVPDEAAGVCMPDYSPLWLCFEMWEPDLWAMIDCYYEVCPDECLNYDCFVECVFSCDGFPLDVMDCYYFECMDMEGKPMIPGVGYWVFLPSPRTLAGFCGTGSPLP